MKNYFAVLKKLLFKSDAKRSETIHHVGASITLNSFGVTDVGRVRSNNEDNYLVSQRLGIKNKRLSLLAVADGMGGGDLGEEASSLVLESLKHDFENSLPSDNLDCKEWLLGNIVKANKKLTKKIKAENLPSMGTTLVLALIVADKAYIANLGDSRAYLLRNGELLQLTKDNSLVALMVEKGLLEAEEIYTHPRRNEIMGFMGKEEIKPDLFELDLKTDDVLLLCSDGLWGMIKDTGIKTILKESTDPEELCRKLLHAANQAGGEDNITAVIAILKD